jgi:competence protein ComEA
VNTAASGPAEIVATSSSPLPAGVSAPVPPSTGQPATNDVCWELAASDRWLLGACGGLAVLLLAAHLAAMARWGAPTVEITSLQPRELHYSLDINAATWVEWLQLPAIGETLARRIVEDREQRGPFDSLEDVTRVRGIGPGTFEQIRPYLRLDREPAAANPVPR